MSESFLDIKISLLESFVRHLPPASVEREHSLDKLAQRLAQIAANTDPRLDNLVLTLTRRTLFSLYEGFVLGSFRGISRRQYFPRDALPDAQVALEERLTNLAHLSVARKEILKWALAALNGELATLLRQGLHSLGRLAIAALDWVPGLSRRNQNPQYEFGLTLLHLLAEDGQFWPEELEALLTLTTQWVRNLPFFPEYEIRDLFRRLHKVSFSPEQSELIASLLRDWEDTNRYPSERSFATLAEYNRAMSHLDRIRGRSKLFTVASSVLIATLGRFRPSLLPIHTSKIRRDIRYGTLAIGWGILAKSEARYVYDLLRVLRSLAEISRAEISYAEFLCVRKGILPIACEQPTALKVLVEPLAEEGLRRFDDSWERAIEASRLSFSLQALQIWLEQVRHRPQAYWLRQVLERIHTLKADAAEWLAKEVLSEENPPIMETILKLTQRLANRDPNLAVQLENGLWRRMRLSIERGEALSPEWARWLAGTKWEFLRQALDLLRQYVERDEPDIRSYANTLLSALAREVNNLEHPDPLRLVVCWLVDPADGLRSNLPLPERLRLAREMINRAHVDEKVVDWLRRAIVRRLNVEDLVQTLHAGGYYVGEKDIERLNAIVQAPDAEKFAQVLRAGGCPEWRLVKAYPRLVPVFFEPLDTEGEWMMRVGAHRRIALARALRNIRDPKLVLPLLEELFELAVDLISVWVETSDPPPAAFPEFSREADKLASELLQTVASLPVTPQVVELLREMVLAPSHISKQGLSRTFSRAFIQSTVLPLLVGREVDAEAIPVMLAMLQEPLPPTAERNLLVRQCILQWLSNISTLDTVQQEIIWQNEYTSSDILTRSLALLVLGRQRPVSKRAWRTILGLLNTPWIVQYIRRTLEIARMRDFFREPNDVFLSLGTAVALSAEWASENETLSTAQFQVLHRAWRRASSDVQRLMEILLSRIGIPPTSVDYARGLALSLCNAVGYDPEDDPDWLIRPADLARRLLQRFSLTKGDDHERARIPSTHRRPAPLL